MSQLTSQPAPVVETPDDVALGPSTLSPSLALVRTTEVDRLPRRRLDRGLVSAEWAMAIIAAVAIVGVLVAVVGSGPVQTMLTRVIVAVLRKAVGLL